GGGAGVLDQVGRAGDAQQAERQSGKLRVLGTAVIAVADRGEELVRREREGADRVDLVHGDDELTRAAEQYYRFQRPQPPLQGREPLVRLPVLFQLVFEIE